LVSGGTHQTNLKLLRSQHQRISQAPIQSDYYDFTLTGSERRPTLYSSSFTEKVRIFPVGARGISLAKYSSPVPA